MKKQLLCMLVLTLLLTGCFKKSDEKMTEQIENQIENILAISDTQNAAIDYSETAQTERVVMEKTQVKVVRIVDDTIAILSIEAIICRIYLTKPMIRLIKRMMDKQIMIT